MKQNKFHWNINVPTRFLTNIKFKKALWWWQSVIFCCTLWHGISVCVLVFHFIALHNLLRSSKSCVALYGLVICSIMVFYRLISRSQIQIHLLLFIMIQTEKGKRSGELLQLRFTQYTRKMGNDCFWIPLDVSFTGYCIISCNIGPSNRLFSIAFKRWR